VTVSLLNDPSITIAPREGLTNTTARDLELDRIATDMSSSSLSRRAILDQLLAPSTDARQIRYRQDVFRDIWKDTRLTLALSDSIRMMEEITVYARSASSGTHPLLESVWRLSELELFVELADHLSGALEQADPQSRGLTSLRDELNRSRSDAAFAALREELPALRSGLRLRRSVTLAVNLDDRLRPVEAALLSVNEKPFTEGQFLSRFFGAIGSNPFVTRTPLHKTSPDSLLDASGYERLPLSPLFQELETVLRSVLRPLSRALRDYVSVSTDIFAGLLPEIAFLCGASDFFSRVAAAGHTLCFPEVLAEPERVARFDGLYNLHLASRRIAESNSEPIVCNSIRMDEHARMYVLTGPNGGGKTTFTQAVGIAIVLAQIGLPVPAKSAGISPVDRIFTHFPVEEDYDDNMGRFEDEARRISEVFDSLSDRSLALLNEPFTSTEPGEAVSVTTDVLAGFAMSGARGICTTHFHEVARATQSLNNAVGGPSRIGAISAGIRDEGGERVRTYRISEGQPEGLSHADDIAHRFGIDFESLRNRFSPSAGQGGTPPGAPPYQLL